MRLFRSHKEVQDWINEHVEDADENAALWFMAYNEAQSISVCYSSKDIAHLLMDGVPKMTPERFESILFSFYEEVAFELSVGPLEHLPAEITQDLADELSVIDVEQMLKDFYKC